MAHLKFVDVQMNLKEYAWQCFQECKSLMIGFKGIEREDLEIEVHSVLKLILYPSPAWRVLSIQYTYLSVCACGYVSTVLHEY